LWSALAAFSVRVKLRNVVGFDDYRSGWGNIFNLTPSYRTFVHAANNTDKFHQTDAHRLYLLVVLAKDGGHSVPLRFRLYAHRFGYLFCAATSLGARAFSFLLASCCLRLHNVDGAAGISSTEAVALVAPVAQPGAALRLRSILASP
jgi:hypothetical protein